MFLIPLKALNAKFCFDVWPFEEVSEIWHDQALTTARESLNSIRRHDGHEAILGSHSPGYRRVFIKS